MATADPDPEYVYSRREPQCPDNPSTPLTPHEANVEAPLIQAANDLRATAERARAEHLEYEAKLKACEQIEEATDTALGELMDTIAKIRGVLRDAHKAVFDDSPF